MVLWLLLSVTAPAPAGAEAAAARTDPPVKVWLNQDNHFQRGDKAQVNVKLDEDGYLVVLRADAHGRVRVLFPLDPGDDAFARGGETREIRGRGDREAFSIDEREGSGLVLVARSATPFKFDEFARGDHWDYRVLTARDAGDDKEQPLLDIVQRMVPDGHFDYDVVNYAVASPRSYYDGAHYPYSPFVGLGLGYGFGWPRFSFSLAFGNPSLFRPFFFRARCFDPFFFDPFLCDPFFGDPFFFRHRFFFFSRVFVLSRTVIVLHGRTGVVGGIPFRQPFLIDGAHPEFRGAFVFTARTPIPATGPRLRVPTSALPGRKTPANSAGPPREPGPREVAIRDRRASLEQRLPERLHQPSVSGWGRAPTLRDRGFSVRVSGRTFALPSRPASPLRRGGGGRRH